MVGIWIVDFVGEAREFHVEEDAIDALCQLIGDAKSLQEIEGLIESNAPVAAYPLIIEAYKDKKEALSNPGNRQDRPATGAPQLDPARDATASAETGQTEHPGGASPSTPDSRKAQELPAATRAATPVAAKNTTERPRDEPKQTAPHAKRNGAFWSKTKFNLPGDNPKEVLYYLGKYLRQSRDQFDVNGLETDNTGRFEQMSLADRREAEQMIASRRKEIGDIGHDPGRNR